MHGADVCGHRRGKLPRTGARGQGETQPMMGKAAQGPGIRRLASGGAMALPHAPLLGKHPATDRRNDVIGSL